MTSKISNSLLVLSFDSFFLGGLVWIPHLEHLTKRCSQWVARQEECADEE